MKYTNLGKSGATVSKIALGCMGFGDKDKWNRGQWILDESNSFPIIKKALELGINYFDTADSYSNGESERILGKAIRKYANRDDVVISTKIYFPTSDGLNGSGLSRKHIMQSINRCLERLQTDYIDLLIMHRFDNNTPLEETMSTLNDLVRSGKVLYLGASAMYAWQFQKANVIAKEKGYAPLIVMQNHYNLLYREEEREMIPYCQSEGIGITPYSPLAAGRLSRSWSGKTVRYQSDINAKERYDQTMQQDKIIVDRVGELAALKGVSYTQIALAWLLSKPYVVAPIFGASKLDYLDDAIGALDVSLSNEEIDYLESCYLPHAVKGPR